jgi:hypothetical protein
MTKAPSGRLSTMALAKKAWSATCRLGDSEAVFQHLKADNFTIGDSEHDREVCSDDFAGSLEFGHERAKDHCPVVTGLFEMQPRPHARYTFELDRRNGACECSALRDVLPPAAPRK